MSRPAHAAGREEDNAVALVRVYCGVATAEMAPWLTVAVVDDAGRLLDMRHISDDPAGYAYLVTLLAERSGGSCSVAMDRHDHLVAQLLAAANRPLAIADEMALRDLSERFSDDSSYEEMQAPASQRQAIGLARALQAGALYATAQSPSWDLDELKPLLSAHGAVVAGRQAAAVALREVLREIYPAALRAFLDPAEFVPLKILDAFPEPGLVAGSPSTQSRESAVIAELTTSGASDTATAVNAITALRVAVEESRGWNTNRLPASGVAETVRQAVAAVRACDAAMAALVGSLGERLNAIAGAMPTRVVHPAAAPVSPAVPRRANPAPAAEVPPSRIAPRASAASAAAAGVGVSASAGTATAYGIPAPRPEPNLPSSYASADYSAYSQGSAAEGGSGSTYGSSYDAGNGSSYDAGNGSSYDGGSSYGSTNGSSYDGGSGSAYGNSSYGAGNGSPFGGGNGSGWEQQYGAPPSYGPDTLAFSMDPLTAPLSPAGSGNPEPAREVRPADGRPDDDLLIFSQANSVWFTDADGPDAPTTNWVGLSDDGWRAAEKLTVPNAGPETTAGLPRRVPAANLVPGSAAPPPRQVRIVRDAKSIAAHTEGYFRGWRRGQEIGGFAVGQRDRGAWEFNREQRARQGAARLS
jgi:hypothetical protein